MIQTGTFHFRNQDNTLGLESKLLTTIARSADEFSSGIGWAEGVNNLLAGLGRALGVQRSCLFQTIEINDKHLIQDYMFEWVPSPKYKLLGMPLLSMMTRSVDMPGYKELIASRKRGEWQMVVTSREEPGPLYDILKVQDIKSMLTIPVMVENEWWGTLGFDDCEKEREWSSKEISLLRNAAQLISSAVLCERLAAQRKQLNIVKEFTGFNTWEFDLQRGRLWCSANLVRSAPAPSESASLSMLQTLRFIHPEDRKTLIKAVKTYLTRSHEIVCRCDLRILMKDGTIRWVQLIGKLQSSTDGKARRLAGIAVDIFQTRREQQSSCNLTATDPLTGALSRQEFEQQFALWQNCSSESCQCSLLLIGLDHFQRFNRNYGHNVGDKLLKHFVENCRAVLQEKDLLARLDGDRFAILLPATGAEKAKTVSENLLDRLEQTPITIGLESLSLSATIGIAVHSTGQVKPANLILRADSALHVAKQRGCRLLWENELT